MPKTNNELIWQALEQLGKNHDTLRELIDLAIKNQAKLDFRLKKIEDDFAQMRLDLKAAMIIQDEPYNPPPVDELSSKPTTKKDSKKVQKLKRNDPFG